MNEKNIKRACLILTVFFCFLSILLTVMMNHIQINIQYEQIPIKGKTIYQTEEPTQPVIPDVNLDEDTLVLIDKSGSMKDFVTEMYLKNVDIFSKPTIWWFDTDVVKENLNIKSIDFSGDTDIIKAINEGIKAGYESIALFSDMEQTVDVDIVQQAEFPVHIYIFSPHELNESSEKIIENLKDSESIDSIKLLALYGLYEE